MAPSSSSPSPRFPIPFFSLLLLLLLATAFLSTPAAACRLEWGRRKVGDWTEIPDANSNKEARDLGRYSVNEYNRWLRLTGENPLAFSSVVSAARQVVAGIKYRIRVAAVDDHTGKPRSFDAVVVVRPWLRNRDRDLVSFTPLAE